MFTENFLCFRHSCKLFTCIMQLASHNRPVKSVLPWSPLSRSKNWSLESQENDLKSYIWKTDNSVLISKFGTYIHNHHAMYGSIYSLLFQLPEESSGPSWPNELWPWGLGHAKSHLPLPWQHCRAFHRKWETKYLHSWLDGFWSLSSAFISVFTSTSNWRERGNQAYPVNFLCVCACLCHQYGIWRENFINEFGHFNVCH